MSSSSPIPQLAIPADPNGKVTAVRDFLKEKRSFRKSILTNFLNQPRTEDITVEGVVTEEGVVLHYVKKFANKHEKSMFLVFISHRPGAPVSVTEGYDTQTYIFPDDRQYDDLRRRIEQDKATAIWGK